MLKRFQPQVAWLIGLLSLSLLLAACGGAAQPAPTQETAAATTADASCSTNESCGPTSTEEAAAPATTAPQAAAPVTATTQATGVATTTEAASSPAGTAAPAAASKAICQAVEIPSNSLIAAVSDQDWAKGPATAPVTLIEYGDFQ